MTYDPYLDPEAPDARPSLARRLASLFRRRERPASVEARIAARLERIERASR